MDVGTAKGNFKLDGINRSIADLKKMSAEMRNISVQYKTWKAARKAIIAQQRSKDSAATKTLQNTKSIFQAERKVNEALQKRLGLVKQIRSAQAKATSEAANRGSAGLSAPLQHTTGKVLAAQAAKISSAVKSKMTLPTGNIDKYNAAVKRLTSSIMKNFTASKGWMSQFGAVAAGFWVAYRAINAVELAISTLWKTFTRGLSILDEFQENVAGTAGMLAMATRGLSGFDERFVQLNNHMKNVMTTAQRLGPTVGLSMEEMGAGFRELAQFGVIVREDMAENTVVSFSAIKEIAMTVGSSTKQIRQEIQSLFNGQTRVTDQFGRMLKTTMPELAKKVFDISDAAVDNEDKWRMVIEAMSDYRKVLDEANKSLRKQYEIASNNVSIISSLALKNSGIYTTWVETIQDFNKSLFKTDGTLTKLGIKLFNIFGDLWQLMQKLINVGIAFYNVLADVFNLIVRTLSPYQELIKFAMKWAAALFIAKAALGAIVGSVGFLVKILGVSTAINAFKGITAFITVLRNANLSSAASSLAAIAKPIAVISAASFALSTGYITLVSSVGGISKVIDKFTRSLGFRKFVAFFTLDSKELKKLMGSGKTQLPGTEVDDYSKTFKKNFDKYYQGSLALIEAKAKKLKESASGMFDGIFSGETQIGSGVPSSLDSLMSQLGNILNFDDIPGYNPEKQKANIDGIFSPMTAAIQELKDAWMSVADEIAGSMKSVFGDIATGEIRSFSDFFKRTMDALNDAWQNMLTDMITQQFKSEIGGTQGKSSLGELFSAVSGMFNGNSGPTGEVQGGTGNIAQNPNANGGIIAEPVFGFGTKTGESYSFAEKGPERVLSNKDSFSSPKQGDTTVNVINKTGKQFNAQSFERFEGKDRVLDLIIEDYNEGGRMRDLLGGT